jgi:hypothetical protein
MQTTGSDGGQVSGRDAGIDIATPAAPKCGSTPTQLVDFDVLAAQLGPSSISAMQLAVDGTNVYFVFGDHLIRVPIRGGVVLPSKLSLNANVGENPDPIVTPTAVALHFPDVNTKGNDEKIVAVPLQGGNETILATSHARVWALTADDNNAYFADSDGIKSVPLAGGDAQLLNAETSQITPGVTGLAVVGSNVIATLAAGQEGEVVSVPIQGGSLTTLATQQPSASFPMACNSDTCWWTGAAPSLFGPTGAGYIARLTDAGVTTLAGRVYPWSIAFDGSNFFETVGCDECPGTLLRIPSSGAPLVPMVSAGSVAVDDACAYFSVVAGDATLPSQSDGGLPGTGIYSVDKSYMAP